MDQLSLIFMIIGGLTGKKKGVDMSSGGSRVSSTLLAMMILGSGRGSGFGSFSGGSGSFGGGGGGFGGFGGGGFGGGGAGGSW